MLIAKFHRLEENNNQDKALRQNDGGLRQRIVTDEDEKGQPQECYVRRTENGTL